MRRRVLLTVPVLLITSAVGTGFASASLPTGVTDVAVTSSHVTANVNGHLHAARTISGTVKTSSGKLVSGIVQAYLNGRYASSTFTSNGSYTIRGLAAKSYAICVPGATVFSPSSPTGFLGRCYRTAAYNGFSVPSNATLVSLASGNRAHIDVSIPAAAAITGRITTPSGSGLSGATVQAFNKSSHAVFYSFTTGSGAYSIKGLTAAAKGYSVCVNPAGVGSGTGYLPRCYKNKAWNGTTAGMANGSTIAVALGHVHTNVNQVVPRGGAISGKIVDAGNGKPIAAGSVFVFDAAGHIISGAGTNNNGTYLVRGLAASTGYRVCATPASPTATLRYHGLCWKAIAYNGGRLPRGTSPVSVTLGHTHTGINFRLTKTILRLGSIAGVVTERAGGHPVQFASVDVMTSSGGFVGSASTNAAGQYTVTGLPASSTGYVVCVSAATASSTIPTPTTGWAPRCYVDAAWTGLGVPSAAHRLPLSAGQHRTGINVAVRVGGGISGIATQFGSATPVLGALVELFTTGGRLITSTSSDFSDGTYSINGLTPGNYVVCFDGRNVFTGSGYLPQCYNGVAWSG